MKKQTTSNPSAAQVPAKRSAQTQVATQDLLSKMAQDAGQGMEGADRDAFAIPFIRVLQQLSPQCTKGKAGYTPKAAPGFILNTVTGEIIDGEVGIMFVPCAYQRRFIQWGPRGSAEGSGFKKEWLPERITEALSTGEELFPGSGTLVKSDEDGKLYLGGTNPKKNDLLADTRNHFGLVLTDNGPVQVLLSLSGSQVKKSKQLMGILSAVRVNGVTPPTWLNKIHITTTLESNDQGSWYSIRVEHAGFIEDERTYEAGKTFHDLIATGHGSVSYAQEEEATESTSKF
jgi:hypothetical protein